MIDVTKLTPLAKAMIIENIQGTSRLARARVRLDEKPVEAIELPTREGVCRLTNMKYTVCYTPYCYSRAKKRPMMKPYQISCDLFAPKNVARFRDWEDFSTSDHPVAVWLFRNTTIDRTAFDLAFSNMFMEVPFCIDYAAYMKKGGISK